MNSKVFWQWCMGQWKKPGPFHLVTLWRAYEVMRGKPISGPHFIGKFWGD